MSIAVKPCKSSRIRATIAQHPGASPVEIGRMLGLRSGDVHAVLARRPVRRRKSVAHA